MFTTTALIKFIFSFSMVFLSSYFFTCALLCKDKNTENKYGTGFICFILAIFAQVILTFEILSLFKQISEPTVLTANVFFLIISIYCWFKSGYNFYIPDIKNTFIKIIKGIKKDKFLMIMSFGFVFFIIMTILINLITPISNFDALTYHLNRASFWLTQGSLNHFTTPDERNLVMPINSEILYLWVILFFKNDIGLRFVSFFGYIASVVCLYNILELFGFSERKKIWSVFILSSLASVLVEASSSETDVLIAGLVLSSILLFLVSLKQKRNILLYFSSLAYAIAMGTKSPAVIAFPGVFLLLTYFSYQKEKKEFYKPVLAYLGFLFVNFLIFSSYNYILNFIDYGNPLGTEAARKSHGFRGGFKAIIANYIRYIFMLFDFSGFKYSDYVGEHINNFKFAIFDFLRIGHELGVEMSDKNIINNKLLEVKMGTGLLGFLLFLPATITSVILVFCKKYSKKAQYICAFGAMFFINLFCLSFSIAYMVFSVRFVTFLVVISSPVLALSYIKQKNIISRLIKLFILYIVLSYFLVMSINITARSLSDIIKVTFEEKTLNDARERLRCALYFGADGKMSFCYLRDIIRSTPKGTSFGVFPSMNSRLYIISMLNNEGYKIDVLLPEIAESYDVSKYDYLITTNRIMASSYIADKKTENVKMKYKIDKDLNSFFNANSKEKVNCVYIDHQTQELFDPKNQGKKGHIITQSSCYFLQDFFTNRNFSILKEIDFKSDVSDNANYMTIYKNDNK